jgi:hypothetical protein
MRTTQEGKVDSSSSSPVKIALWDAKVLAAVVTRAVTTCQGVLSVQLPTFVKPANVMTSELV